jgi:hypothetical protein
MSGRIRLSTAVHGNIAGTLTLGAVAQSRGTATSGGRMAFTEALAATAHRPFQFSHSQHLSSTTRSCGVGAISTYVFTN